jgi:hypothetical protein
MPPINFPDILNQLKTGLIDLAQTSLKDFAKDAKSDAQNLLNTLQDDLQKWTEQLAAGDIDINDFKFLLDAKKDLIEMAALKQAGLMQIKIDQFKNEAFNLVVNIVEKLIP